MILGADFSFWVDKNNTPRGIDFHKMRDAGVRFAFIRAGQGSYFDEDYIRNFQESAGIIPRGAYWFFDDRMHPQDQAELFHAIIEEAGGMGELPWVIDLEKTAYWSGVDGEFANWKYWYTFIALMKQYYPDMRPIIYTGYWYWVEHTPLYSIPEASLQWFADDCDLWLANYVKNHDEAYLLHYAKNMLNTPRPFERPIIWQFTGSGDGLKYGVESAAIDLNIWTGDENSFLEFIGGAQDTPTLPQEEPGQENGEIMYTGKVTVPSLRIRDAIWGAPIGAYTAGKIIEASETRPDSQGGEWWKTVDGWVCAKQAGVAGRYVEVATAPPSDGVTVNRIAVYNDDGTVTWFVPEQ